MFARITRIAPRRGWRAFVGEVGIIVLGVLIAVAIGKGVEALDWRGRVADARAALDEQIAADTRYDLTERLRVTPCLLRQLDRLRSIALQTVGRPGGAPLYRSVVGDRVYVHPSRAWSEAEWQTVVVDGVPSHMPSDLRRFYQDMFVRVRQLAALNTEETAAAADLFVLAEPVALDPAARAGILGVLARQRQRVRLMQLIAAQGEHDLRRSGRRTTIGREVERTSNTVKWCRANGLL